MRGRRLALDPLDEPAHRRVIELYAATGNRAEALRQYRECVRVLDRELGVRPLPETTELYQAVNEGRLATTRAGERRCCSRCRRACWSGGTASGSSSPRPTRRARRRTCRDARGRGRDRQDAAGRGARRPRARARRGCRDRALVRGRGGAAVRPRRRHAACCARRARRRRAARRRRPRAGRGRAARARAGRRAGPAPEGGPGARQRFYEGLALVLVSSFAGPAPGVLFLDDLQWADRASLDVLAYVARRLAAARS